MTAPLSELSEQTLTEVLEQLMKLATDRDHPIALRPTKITIVRWPGEPLQDFFERLDRALIIMEQFK